MVFSLGIQNTFACLATDSGVGTVSDDLSIVRFVWYGVVRLSVR